MNLKVAFEWTHRVVAGSVSLAFVALAVSTLRRRATRDATSALLAVAAGLLVAQVALGALTVWKLLAAWTVTAHLVTGNAFAVVLLWTALTLREQASPRARNALPAAARTSVWLAAGLLALQMVIGGLVASRYAGLVCPEWPTCTGGVWFPTWRGGVGLHLLHRWNAFALLLSLAFAARATRGTRVLGGVALVALGLACAQVVVGIANVLMAIPIEITGLHSALAASLVLCLAVAVRETWLAPARDG
jgi:cytochrome c oxidase assembly protein subunit 15